MTESVRPRTTVGQWLTLAAVVGVGTIIVGQYWFTWTFIGGAGRSLGDAVDEQVFKEALCIPYANGVLELAAAGYTPEQITAVYEAAAIPVDDDGSAAPMDRDQSNPTSWAVHFCGAPSDIVTAAGS